MIVWELILIELSILRKKSTCTEHNKEYVYLIEIVLKTGCNLVTNYKKSWKSKQISFEQDILELDSQQLSLYYGNNFLS